MSDNIMKIMCPKCLEVSEFEYQNNKILVDKDDFVTDLLNQGFTKGYMKGKAETIGKLDTSIHDRDVIADFIEILKKERDDHFGNNETAKLIFDDVVNVSYLRAIKELRK